MAIKAYQKTAYLGQMTPESWQKAVLYKRELFYMEMKETKSW